jgi:hypothetical protein
VPKNKTHHRYILLFAFNVSAIFHHFLIILALIVLLSNWKMEILGLYVIHIISNFILHLSPRGKAAEAWH